MVDLRANVEIFCSVAVLGFAAIQTVVAGLSFQRMRSPRLGAIALAFAMFTAKGAYLAWTSWRTRGSEPWVLVTAAFDLAILLLLYWAVRSR